MVLYVIMNREPVLAPPEDVVADPYRRGLLRTAGLVGVGLLAAACGRGYIQPLEAPTPRPPEQASPPEPYQYPDMHKGLKDSSDPELRQLAKYEAMLGHGLEHMTLVTDLPRNTEEAKSQAETMRRRLLEWGKRGIKPIVIMEPRHGEENAELSKLHSPAYIGIAEAAPGVLDTYFRTLRWAGISDEQMGTWIPYPEPNVSKWAGGVTDSDTFRANVTGAAQCIKAHFPNAKVSVVLDSAPYSTEHSTKSHLLQYVKGINHPNDPTSSNLIDSFGIQGLPQGYKDRAERFLSAQATIACANELGVKDVWVTTGSAAGHTASGGGRLTFSDATRGGQLWDELQQLRLMQAAGLNVGVNLFARNEGGVDWSYSRNTHALGLLEAALTATSRAGFETNLII